MKASPVSVTIPWSIHLPRVTSRKTEQREEGRRTGKGVNRSSSFRAARLAKRDVAGFVPFRISKTIRHPQGEPSPPRDREGLTRLYHATSDVEGERADFRRNAVIRGAIVLSDGTATDIKVRAERCSLCHSIHPRSTQPPHHPRRARLSSCVLRGCESPLRCGAFRRKVLRFAIDFEEWRGAGRGFG